MSQEAIITLLKLVERDEALLGELQEAKTHEKKAAVAVKHGCDVRAEELAVLQALSEKDGGGELSDAELEIVGGGSIRSFLKRIFSGNSDNRRSTRP